MKNGIVGTAQLANAIEVEARYMVSQGEYMSEVASQDCSASRHAWLRYHGDEKWDNGGARMTDLARINMMRVARKLRTTGKV